MEIYGSVSEAGELGLKIIRQSTVGNSVSTIEILISINFTE